MSLSFLTYNISAAGGVTTVLGIFFYGTDVMVYAELQNYKTNLLPKSYFTRTFNHMYQAFPTTGIHGQVTTIYKSKVEP